MSLKHKVTLVVGDWSFDGHNQTETYVIDSNLTAKEIETAYKKGCKIIGFNLSADVSTDYEDSHIYEPEIQKLIAAGYTEWEPGEDGELVDDNEDGCYISADDFVNIYLFFVKTGNPAFEHEIGNSDSSRINIGGYGLFGS